MDQQPLRIKPLDLYARLGTAAAPLVVDLRDDAAFADDDRLLIGAIRPRDETWSAHLRAGRSAVAYGADEGPAGDDIVTRMRASGIAIASLAGGFAAWRNAKLPVRRTRGPQENKWVTRERPKIDRIACPWLISRFVNPAAEFIYVRASEVAAAAASVGGTAYDIPDVEFGHVGDRCSFDAILQRYDIHDPALDLLARIVRGADTSRPDLAPQCAGLLAISYGLSANYADDHAMLAHGLIMYDALFTWCRRQTSEASA